MRNPSKIIAGAVKGGIALLVLIGGLTVAGPAHADRELSVTPGDCPGHCGGTLTP